ncbi:MAG: PfkB family carbohydrate kinase [Candidatus Thermoplasmatota archaeon]|nr:PfkB family carbohydrate kinase [Candidatus Thermoplasmatota archaeon]MEC8609806.1 PfkB family carbohydrate kinase [Candidatus Thermoplasmatota archaeon]
MGMSDNDAKVYDALKKLERGLKTMEPANVLLVGDIMMDCYIHGFANNLNSRAPVPVLKETSRDVDVGAAAHVARGLDSLGLNSHLHGIVGDDNSGIAILEMLEEEGVQTSGIAVLEGRTTTVKTRLLGAREGLIKGEQLLLRWDIEDDEPISSNALETLIDRTIEAVPNSSCLILSDYGLGVLDDKGAQRLIQAAKEHNVPIIADPKLTGLHRTQGVDWVLFQSKGLELMRRRLGATTGVEAASMLLETNEWKHLLILEGQDGVTIHSKNEETVHVQCMLEDIRQMIGLIDAAAVAVATAITLNLSVEETAQLANAASECILNADRTERFVLRLDDMIERIGEIAWSLQVSKR